MSITRITDHFSWSERFWRRVVKGPGEECWAWNGMHSSGYGYLRVGSMRDGTRRSAGAHRLALEVSLGRELLPGMQALHRCDNRGCVNPGHLFEGTQRDNVEDMERKGRRVSVRGNRHPKVRFSDEEVRKIRASSERDKDLAAFYSCHPSTINKVRHGVRRPGPP